MPSDTAPNLVDRFAELLAAPGDREAAVLTLLTTVGAHLGRSSGLNYRNRRIYPTLYSLIVGTPGIVTQWYDVLSRLPDSPPATQSGLYSAEALVHIVRDEVWRPDKIYTEPGEDPEWRITPVDPGVGEKRHLILQPLAAHLASKTAPARRLVDTLNAAYSTGALRAYVGYRDGGFHEASGAHIALLVPESEEQIAVLVSERLPVLIARASGPSLDPDELELLDILSDFSLTISKTPSEVTVSPGCGEFLNAITRSTGPIGVLTVLRLAHVLAVLARSSFVSESFLNRSVSIVNASVLTRQQLQNKASATLGDEILEFVRVAEHRARREVLRHFRRFSSAALIAALAELEQAGRLNRVKVRGKGRSREELYIPNSGGETSGCF